MMFSISRRRLWLALLALAIATIVSACAESDSTVNVDANGETSITMSPPSFIDARILVDNVWDLKIIINGIPVDMLQQVGTNVWVGSGTVNRGDSIELLVEWSSVQPDNSLLLVARAFYEQASVNTDLAFRIVPDSFITTGEDFDEDGDDISNLEELRRGLNPRQADAPTSDIEADVQVFGTGDETEIDGSWGQTSYWDTATHTDVNGEDLTINNMIRDDNPALNEGLTPDHRWAAIHDGEYLSIFVFGKYRNASRPVNGDSTFAEGYHNDDSLEIYLDGNLSESAQAYDNVDDLLISIPLARGNAPEFEENRSGESNTRIALGGNVKVDLDVQDPAIVSFGTCFCGGSERTTWEVKINMAAAQIPIGRTFGFEIQLNIDDDGGRRDSKWAWAKPPRQANETNEEADVTWRYPIHMGKMRLIGFAE